MAPPRTYRCEALTLRKYPLGEADLLVTLFAKDRGKLRAVAKERGMKGYTKYKKAELLQILKGE